MEHSLFFNQSVNVCLGLVGVELYCGHGGKNAAVSERAQKMPGGRSGGTELLETALK